jgi:pilus assembly protein CpaF
MSRGPAAPASLGLHGLGSSGALCEPARDADLELPEHLVDLVRGDLARSGGPATPAKVARVLRARGSLLGDQAVLAIAEQLGRELTGAGVLTPLLADPAVTDVLVHGPGRAFVDRGRGLEPVEVRLPDEAAVRRLATRLAALAGRRLDDAHPYVDARLPSGERLHAVLQPISRHGTAISVRIPARRSFTLDDLVRAGTMPTEIAGLLADVVASALALLICGGTGSGKTTLLAALLALVPGDQRLVIVEDSTELMPDHPHVVHLEARPPNAEGVGEITVRTLVRQALRMRPDRLVVGEVRGAEVVDLLAACNTGHEGGCGTVHANGASQVPARMEALGVAAGLDRQAVHSQLAAAIDVVVSMRRGGDGSRLVDSVSVLTMDSTGLVRCLPAVSCTGDGRVVLGEGADMLDDLLHARLPGQHAPRP